MRFFKRRKLLGFWTLAVGSGIMMVMVVPTIGWIFFSGVCLICLGVYLLKC